MKNKSSNEVKYFTDLDDQNLQFIPNQIPCEQEVLDSAVGYLLDGLLAINMPKLERNISIVFDIERGNSGDNLLQSRKDYMNETIELGKSLVGDDKISDMTNAFKDSDLEFSGEFGRTQFYIHKIIEAITVYLMTAYSSKGSEGSTVSEGDDYLILKWLGFNSARDIVETSIGFNSEFRDWAREIFTTKLAKELKIEEELLKDFITNLERNYRIVFARNKLEKGYASNTSDLDI